MTTVETTAGAVQGRMKDGIFDFRGIPFAAPPVGELRFRPPQPVEPWTGVRDATAFGPMAMQNQGVMETMFGAPPRPMSEDCLTLNVWTPGLDDARRPVMVWIHGGGFLFGTGATPWYDGRSFARDDIVLVTINYRLGSFGFLHIDGQGNNGILDQVAALEWVRDNIAAFGGDPGNVTAFGESAGAMSVGTLLGLPAAKGLFVKAIPESGAAHAPRTAEQAEELVDVFLTALDVDNSPVKHAFTFTPSISLFVDCESEAEQEAAFSRLSDGGGILMPLGSYGFSTRFGWVCTRYGNGSSLRSGLIQVGWRSSKYAEVTVAVAGKMRS